MSGNNSTANIFEYYQKYKDLKKDNYIFTYSGNLKFSDIILFKDLIEKILEMQSAENKQKRRIINILIEALQNIYCHGELQLNNLDQSDDCLLLLKKENSIYHIVIGNFIKNSAIENLKTKLDNLNKLEIPDLKKLYREILSKGELTGKGGASIGLVKIFMDSSKNIAYEFKEIKKEHSFFTLEIKVSNN